MKKTLLSLTLLSFQLVSYSQINQYSTPVEYDYSRPRVQTIPQGRPANYTNKLESMQQEYDKMKYDISSYQFSINYLDVDRLNARTIINRYQNNFKMLLESLIQTKNYREARTIYNRAINEFNSLSEKLAIEMNYYDYQKAEELRITLVKSGMLSLAEYQSWTTSVMSDFKSGSGTNYKSSYSYNLISDIIKKY